MSNMFINPLSQEDLSYDGFFDGQNKAIPEGAELEFIVTDGFAGIEEGKSVRVCMINLTITAPGEFFGQKYRYNAKIYDMDANKRDLAMRNLGVLDAQAGFPMTSARLPITTENIQSCWVGRAQARAKFGMFVNEAGEGINFIRGFAYLRDKMIRSDEAAPAAQAAQPAQAQQAEYDDPDVDF